MLILLRDTDLDGQPIIGIGLLIPGKDAREIVQKMQATSPFNAGDLEGYMRRVLDGAGDTEPLPPESEPAARAFLERLARHGLVAFMPDAPTAPANDGADAAHRANDFAPEGDAPCADKRV